MFLEQAGVDMENLVPRNIFVPVNPRHTAQEWQEIYAAAVTSPEDNTNYKKGTEPQPGWDLFRTFNWRL